MRWPAVQDALRALLTLEGLEKVIRHDSLSRPFAGESKAAQDPQGGNLDLWIRIADEGLHCLGCRGVTSASGSCLGARSLPGDFDCGSVKDFPFSWPIAAEEMLREAGREKKGSGGGKRGGSLDQVKRILGTGFTRFDREGAGPSVTWRTSLSRSLAAVPSEEARRANVRQASRTTMVLSLRAMRMT